MSFIGATGLNTFDDEIENTSNYITRTSFDTSNYILDTSNILSNHILDTSNYILDTSNILTNYFLNDTSNFIIETSNLVSNHILNTSNYTTRIEGQLSDRIGYPAPLFPLEQPTGVYFPLKTQELLLADAGRVLGAHTIALAGIEEQILGLVGTGGVIGLITGGAVGTALSIANTAKNRADDAHTRVDNLITTTTQDKEDTSNYILNTSNILITDYDNKILNTSNVISTRINNLNSGSVPTIENVFPLFYNNHFQQISDGLNPNQISVKNINSSGRFDYEFLKIPPIIPPAIENIIEPTSSPSVPKITINSEYKYMSFSNIITPDINYNFTTFNTLESWVAYANTIPNATTSLTEYNLSFDGVWRSSEQVGIFEFILPATHDYLEITWGNAYIRPAGAPVATTSLSINGAVVDSITDIIQSKTYLYHYTGTPIVRVSEGFSIISANIVIKLVKKAIYTMTFTENTEVELLIASNSFSMLIGQFTQPTGNITITVGREGGHSSFGSISTSTQTVPYNSFNSSITGTNITYNSAIVIVRFKYTKIVLSTIASTGFLNYTNANGWALSQVSAVSPLINITEVVGITRITGNVGIGNTAPNFPLTIGTNLIGGSDGKISIGKNNGTGGNRFFTLKYNNNFDMCFSDLDNKDVLRVSWAAPANSLVVRSDGNVGIGVSSPGQKLSVSGNINATGNITSSSMNANTITSGGDLGFIAGYCQSLQSSGFIGTNGNLSCVTLFTGGNVWHYGAGREALYFGTDGRNYYRSGGSPGTPHTWRRGDDNTIMFVNNDGYLFAAGFLNSSDERIKKDIVDINDTEALDKILLIQPKKYKYIDEEKGTHEVIGFIAQQVMEIIPHAVKIGEGKLPNGDEIQDFHYLDKMIIYTLNVSATQELHRMILRQQTIIDSLIARIEMLESV